MLDCGRHESPGLVFRSMGSGIAAGWVWWRHFFAKSKRFFGEFSGRKLLIVGPMPSDDFTAGQPSPFRMAVTLDGAGDGIAATGFVNDNCNSGMTAVSYGLTGAVGSVASDGSFTVQTSAATIDNQSVVIRGSLPKTPGAPWSGTYSAAITSMLDAGCQPANSGSFTAISFPLVHGVYAGTASWAPSAGTSCTFPSAGTICTPTTASGTPAITTMTLLVTLKQGGTATDVRGNTIQGNSVLTGNIKVQGSPCFTSGTTSSGTSARCMVTRFPWRSRWMTGRH